MCVPEPLADQSPRYFLHLFNRVKWALVMTACELVDIPIQVLVAHLVVSTNIAPFQHGSKGFNPVCVGQPVDVFLDTVLDGFSVWDIVVA